MHAAAWNSGNKRQIVLKLWVSNFTQQPSQHKRVSFPSPQTHTQVYSAVGKIAIIYM